MYARLALGGIAWLAVLVLFAAALQQRREAPGLWPQHEGPALVRTLNEPQAERGGRWWTWRVSRAVAAQRALIIEVEAERVNDARAIAAQLIDPVRSHGYEEILIYVRGAGMPREAVARRVQWTPRGGMREMVMTD